jgi:hypothetical protein
LRLQGENIVLKEKVSEAISKISDKKVSMDVVVAVQN